MGFKDLSDKVQDKDILNKVPGLDAATKQAKEKMGDVKEAVVEEITTTTKKAKEKIEGMTK